MIKLDKFIKYLLLTLLILMPILDTTFFFSRVTTLGIVLIIFFILLLTLINNKNSRKPFIYLFIYYILCLIYLIINYIHASGFTSLFPNNFNYSLFSEITTIIKLTIPITLLFILKFNNITKKEYFFIIKYWIIMICGSIILTNIFKISLSSYGNESINYNIFQWSKNIYYTLTASRGFFNYPNQVACIMIMLLVMSCYMFFTHSKKNMVYILLLTISMLMLGTRVSTMGGILTLICTSIFIISYKIFIEKKKSISYIFILIPIILWILILPISPYSNRNIEIVEATTPILEEMAENNIEKSQNIEEKEDDELTEEEKMMIYVDEFHDESKMPEWFYKKYYSYEYDPYFWYNFVKNTNPYEINYRMMEISIIKRIKEVDNRNTNTLFGISNSRIQNVVNIERDFILHYYAYGIIGMLVLLIIYPILLIKNCITTIKYKQIHNFIGLLIIILFIFCAWLTGNIINFVSTTVPLTFIISMLQEKIMNK